MPYLTGKLPRKSKLPTETKKEDFQAAIKKGLDYVKPAAKRVARAVAGAGPLGVAGKVVARQSQGPDASKDKSVANLLPAGVGSKAEAKPKRKELASLDFGSLPNRSKDKAEPKAPKMAAAKPKGYSSGSITTPDKEYKKGRDELGAFYLNATSGMDIHSRKKK